MPREEIVDAIQSAGRWDQGAVIAFVESVRNDDTTLATLFEQTLGQSFDAGELG